MSNYSDISKFIKGTNAAKSPVIPVSAQANLNLDALIYSIETEIKTPEHDDKKSPVMHVYVHLILTNLAQKLQISRVE